MSAPDLLETTVAAASGSTRQLTTAAKVKALLGETSSTYDTLLETIIDQVSDDCARYCALAADNAGAFPTFGAETLRATWYANNGERDDILVLPWRPKLAISSVVENGSSLVSGTDYRLLANGELQRISSGIPIAWEPCYEVVVTLTAGWTLPAGVPASLEARVIDQVRLVFAGRRRDPSLRSFSVPDVYQATYSVIGGDTIGDSGLLKSLEAALASWRRVGI